MGFEQGLSGLNTSSQNLDVIGNNIANSSTVGFKASTTQFADVYANSLYGNGSLTAGLGTRVAAVAQQFTQGNITVTNNPLDVAINGSGFFQLADQSGGGVTSYTRNGQFQLNNSGYLVNSTGQYVCGGTGTPVPIQINTANLVPAATTGVTASLNLNPSSSVLPTSGFSPTTSSSYDYSTTATVYDSQGNTHALGLYFVNTGLNASNQGTWQVYSTIDGSSTSQNLGSISFTSSGQPTTTPLTFSPSAASMGFTSSSGAALTDPIALDLSGVTQQAGNSGVNSISQAGGNAGGSLVNLSIDSQGNINGIYSNGSSQTLGQISLATFNDPNGLIPLGNNQWAATLTSGQGTPNTPGTGVAGSLQAGATEDSNVNLTNSLVDLIVAQRSYQANAQTIKAEDTILQTLVNL